jgi:hypothetical protein
MAGTLVITTLSDGTNSTSATNCIQGSAKAWVQFNGNGGTIRASYNVSSITVSSTGVFLVNFTNAFANADYSVVASSTEAQTRVSDGTAPTTTAVQIKTNAAASTYVSVACFR